MADGNRQTEFHLPRQNLISLLRQGEIVVDMFAGGGGASEALEQALGRPVDIAINHDEYALGMHAANHPFTIHKREDVWTADPRAEAAGRPVGWFHASPDCTHFSQARGGQPRSRRTRALSWVVAKWVGVLARNGNAPRLVSLENVEQILKWGPLVAKRCKVTGRVLTLDELIDPESGRKFFRVADPGERVPLINQQLVPDRKREGQTWRQFVEILRGHGYEVDWRKLVASDFGAGTSRKRLFLIARRDGVPVQWPTPTHGLGLLPLVTAADCIDWSIPCASIFTRKKPLADATLRRIARGIKRYVIDAAEPFIVKGSQSGGNGAYCNTVADPLTTVVSKAEHCLVVPTLMPATHHGSDRINDPQQPVPTITAAHRGELMISAATLVQTGYGERAGQAPRVPGLGKPLGTIVDGQKHAAVAAHLVKFRGNSRGSGADEPVPTITSGAGAARPAGAPHALGVVTAFLEQAAGGPNSNTSRPRGADEPVSTISTKGSQQRLVIGHLHAMAQNVPGIDPTDPLPTVLAGATRFGVVEATLSPEHEAGALQVAAFLVKYYGTALGVSLDEPLDTITTRDRLALVTVQVRGVPYVIVDIGLRMLQRQELFKAQGFPTSYIIDRTADGRRLNVSQSVRMVGNSVSPPPLAAAIRANLPQAEPSRAVA